MMVIGDLKTQTLQGVDLLNHREWYQAMMSLTEIEETEEEKSEGVGLLVKKIIKVINSELRDISREKITRKTSRKTLSDNYIAHQHRVRRTKMKQLEEFNRN